MLIRRRRGQRREGRRCNALDLSFEQIETEGERDEGVGFHLADHVGVGWPGIGTDPLVGRGDVSAFEESALSAIRNRVGVAAWRLAMSGVRRPA